MFDGLTNSLKSIHAAYFECVEPEAALTLGKLAIFGYHLIQSLLTYC